MQPAPPSAPETSSLLPPELADKIATLPLDQLPELLRQQAEKVQRAAYGIGAPPIPPLPQSPPPDMLAPPAEQAPDGGDQGLSAIDPSLVQQATAILAQSGLLPGPSDTLTPDVLAVLHDLAEADAPGLYDLSQPEQVEELLRGVIHGNIRPAAGNATDTAGGGGMGSAPGT